MKPTKRRWKKRQRKSEDVGQRHMWITDSNGGRWWEDWHREIVQQHERKWKRESRSWSNARKANDQEKTSDSSSNESAEREEDADYIHISVDSDTDLINKGMQRALMNRGVKLLKWYLTTISARGPTLDVRFWRLKSVPALKEYNLYNDCRPIT